MRLSIPYKIYSKAKQREAFVGRTPEKVKIAFFMNFEFKVQKYKKGTKI